MAGSFALQVDTRTHAPTNAKAVPGQRKMPAQDVIIEQLIVGILLLAPLVAILPTTFVFHVAASAAAAAAAAVRVTLAAAASALDAAPLLRVALWALQPLCGASLAPGGLDVEFAEAYHVPIDVDGAVHTGGARHMEAGLPQAWNTPGHSAETFGEDVERRAMITRGRRRRCRSSTAPTAADLHSAAERQGRTPSCEVAVYELSNSWSSLAQACAPFWAAWAVELQLMCALDRRLVLAWLRGAPAVLFFAEPALWCTYQRIAYVAT